jgi:hypothetical protein
MYDKVTKKINIIKIIRMWHENDREIKLLHAYEFYLLMIESMILIVTMMLVLTMKIMYNMNNIYIYILYKHIICVYAEIK